jgi:elongation factor Ts
VLVALESEGDKAALEALGKQIAMHIAAAFPMALSADDLDPEVLDRERKIALEKATEEASKSGKEIPADILAKRADGAAAKFAKDNALLSQVFVMDNKTPIAQVVANAAKDVGSAVVLKDYVRFQLGEGIEKEVSDFAAEVAAAAGL